MRASVLLLFILGLSFGKPEGQVIWETQCQRCHVGEGKKDLNYLRQKYRNNPQGIRDLAKVCPWGKSLSDMEIELVSKWIAGK